MTPEEMLRSRLAEKPFKSFVGMENALRWCLLELDETRVKLAKSNESLDSARSGYAQQLARAEEALKHTHVTLARYDEVLKERDSLQAELKRVKEVIPEVELDAYGQAVLEARNELAIVKATALEIAKDRDALRGQVEEASILLDDAWDIVHEADSSKALEIELWMNRYRSTSPDLLKTDGGGR